MRIEHRDIAGMEALPTRAIGAFATIVVAMLWVVLAVVLANVRTGMEQTMLATITIPCLAGITWICLDMATDMALGRAVARIRSRP